MRDLVVEGKRRRSEEARLQLSISREDAAYDRVTRAARRLVADELDTARGHLAMILWRGMWPAPAMIERGDFLPLREWQRHKSRLSEALEDEGAWAVLSAFYSTLGRLRVRALATAAGATLSAEERESLQSMTDHAMVLERVLTENVQVPGDWREHVATIRDAGELPRSGGNPQPTA